MKLQHILSSFLVLGSIISSTDVHLIENALQNLNLDSLLNYDQEYLKFVKLCYKILNCDNPADSEQEILSCTSKITSFPLKNTDDRNSKDYKFFLDIKSSIELAVKRFFNIIDELNRKMNVETVEFNKIKITVKINFFKRMIFYFNYCAAELEAKQKNFIELILNDKTRYYRETVFRFYNLCDQIFKFSNYLQIVDEFLDLFYRIVDSDKFKEHDKDSEEHKIFLDSEKVIRNAKQKFFKKTTELNRNFNDETDESKKAKISDNIDFCKIMLSYFFHYTAERDTTGKSFIKPKLNYENIYLREKVSFFDFLCVQILQCENATDLEQLVLLSLNTITRFSQLDLHDKNGEDWITFLAIKNAIQSALTMFSNKIEEDKKLMDAETDGSKKAKIEGNIGVFQKMISYLIYYTEKQDAIEKCPVKPNSNLFLFYMQEIAKFKSLCDEILNCEKAAELKAMFKLSFNTIASFTSWGQLNRHERNGKGKETILAIQNAIQLALTRFSDKIEKDKKLIGSKTDESKKAQIEGNINVLQNLLSDLINYTAEHDVTEISSIKPSQISENLFVLSQIAKFNSLYDQMLNEYVFVELKKKFKLSINIITNYCYSLNIHDINSKDWEIFITIKNQMQLAVKMFYWKIAELNKNMNDETDQSKKAEIKSNIDVLENILSNLQKKLMRIQNFEKNTTRS